MRRSQERNNMLIVTAAVNYTGGGIIQFFLASYRKIGSTDPWVPLNRNFMAQAVAHDTSLWTANLVDDIFQDFGVELRVQAVNSHGHTSNTVDQWEEIGKCSSLGKGSSTLKYQICDDGMVLLLMTLYLLAFHLC